MMAKVAKIGHLVGRWRMTACRRRRTVGMKGKTMKKRKNPTTKLSSTQVINEYPKLVKGFPKLIRCSNTSISSSSSNSILKKGYLVDLKELFFTPDRDYLVKPDGSQVKVDQLVGNLFLFSRDDYKPPPSAMKPYLVTPPSYLTKELEERFCEIHSHMPWPAIPYCDRKAREHVGKRLDGNNSSFPASICIIDPTGKVLETSSWTRNLIRGYGVEGFPFNPKRIFQVTNLYQSALQSPSLGKLLASPSRDFVISSQGKKVPICDLQHKAVGLFFCVHGVRNPHLGVVKMVYEELKARGEDFEIVLIDLDCTYDSPSTPTEESFWDSFKEMPWLALPFADQVCRRLHNIFNEPDINGRAVLPIIGPGGSYIQFYGFDIILRYGIQAYPFTQEKVAEIEMGALLSLKLGSILNIDAVLERNNGSRATLSTLLRKRVLVFFVNRPRFKSSKFLRMLEAPYLMKKGTDEEFEVIYVSLSKEERSSIPKMPWLLVHPFSEDLAYKAPRLLFKRHDLCVGVAAFGPGGQFLTKASSRSFGKQSWSHAFPFITGDLNKENWKDLVKGYDWQPIFCMTSIYPSFCKLLKCPLKSSQIYANAAYEISEPILLFQPPQ